MDQRLLEAKKSLFEADVHSHFQVVVLSFEDWMFQLLHFDIDRTWSHIDILVCLISILENVTVSCALFHPNHQGIQAASQLVALADMACARHLLSCALALGALLLELLHEARSQLLLRQNLTLALAL